MVISRSLELVSPTKLGLGDEFKEYKKYLRNVVVRSGAGRPR